VKLGMDGEFHLKSRALAEPRLYPDATTVHFHDLSGDGKPKARPARGVAAGAVDLMELLEDAGMVGFGDATPRVCDGDGEAASKPGVDRHAPFQ
jgi:hypothetical protein